MAAVTIRDLRNHGGHVIDRVLAGESLVVTRAGEPVAELRPVRERGLDAATLVARRCRTDRTNPHDFAGIDEVQLVAIPHPDGGHDTG